MSEEQFLDATSDPSQSDSGNVEEGASPSNGGPAPLLSIVIADAISEKDRILFTIHTKFSLPDNRFSECQVSRSHEEFVWLHDQFEDNPEYAGLIIPPSPPRPDFETSREKLLKLTEADGNLTDEEIAKMKTELEAEYLATFKKTVAMHDVFLKRLASHPCLRGSYNLRTFLDYGKDLGVRNKSRRERVQGYLQRSVSDHLSLVVTSAVTHNTNVDGLDEDEELKNRREVLLHYHNGLRDAVNKADKMTSARKVLAGGMILVVSAFDALRQIDRPTVMKNYSIMLDNYEKMRKAESRISTDQDLKLSDTLRYYRDDSQAALALLQRRMRSLQEYAVANKNLEKARLRVKEVPAAEHQQEETYEKFKLLSDSARAELRDFQERRIIYFKQNLVELAELEIKNNINLLQIFKDSLEKLKAID